MKPGQALCYHQMSIWHQQGLACFTLYFKAQASAQKLYALRKTAQFNRRLSVCMLHKQVASSRHSELKAMLVSRPSTCDTFCPSHSCNNNSEHYCNVQHILPFTTQKNHLSGLQKTQCVQHSLAFMLQKNHLSGLRQMLLKVSLWNTQQLMEVKREMQPIVRRNKNKSNATNAYTAFGPQDNKQTVKLQVSCNFVRQPMLGPDSSDSAVALPH